MAIYVKALLLFFIINGLESLPTVVDNQLVDSTKDCIACKSLVSFVDRIQRNDSKLLETAFVNMCNDYSSLPGRQSLQMCQRMVKSVLDLFSKVNKNTFCEELSVCKNPFSQKTIESTVSDDPNCQFCVSVVTNVKEIISGGPTELEVKYFVEDACHYLGGFENECVSFSDQYIDQLFAYVRQSLQPKQFCKSIGACNATISGQKQQFADISEVINIFPANIPLTELKASKPVKTDVECVICKRIVQMIVEELKDNRTEEAIITALENICELFPKKDRSKCDNFIEQYANELIHILVEEGDPSLACALIGVCVPNSVYQTLNRINAEKEKLKTNTGSVKWSEIEAPMEIESNNNKNKCFECELLMHFIQNEIYDFNNEEQIEEFVEHQLCNRMKIVITRDACDQFIRQYGPQVLQLIAQKLFDPSTVCQNELHLCQNSTQITPELQPIENDIQMSQSTKCDLCESIAKQMINMLQDENFDKKFTKVIEKTCNALPRAKRVECELMVEAFAPYFLQTLGHMSDATQVCRSIDMCYSGGVHLLGGHKCSFGPTYWCHTIAHAKACKATHFCKNKVWKPME